MNIILCNDDGIDSKGLTLLAKRLKGDGHNVLVVAPDGNRSGASHSLTFFKNFKVTERFDICECKAYAISGTPADCIKFAKINFPEFNADIVISGINDGHNLGTDVLYSGTVSIACEAAYFGNISFAFSALDLTNINFSILLDYVVEIVNKLLPISSVGDIWNVNFPDINKVKGIKFAKLGKQVYTDRYLNMGNGQFQLVGERIGCEQNDEDCDVYLIEKGYITITPILFDRTNITKIKEIWDNE